MQNLYDHQPLPLSAVKDQLREYHVPDTEGITCHGLVRVFKIENHKDPVLKRYHPPFEARLLSRDLPIWIIGHEISDPKADQLWFWISHFKIETPDPTQQFYGPPNVYEENFVFNYDTKEYLYVTTYKMGIWGAFDFKPGLEVRDRAGFTSFDFLGECDLPHIETAINRYLKVVEC